MNAEKRYELCVAGLKSFMDSCAFTEVVVGLSGGIDSALAATMAADTLGPACVHGVLLPGPYSSQHSIDDATQLAKRLGISAQTISICEPYEAFAKALATPCGGKLSGLAAQNTQARCRMVVLMALSNAYGWMLLNTGNKSEAMMGYSTLYGDTAGAFAVLGGIYKTEVYELANWRNNHIMAGSHCQAVSPIPQNTIDKPPSAELAPDQSDETSLGIDYATLDQMLYAHIERGLDEQALLSAGFDETQVTRVLARVRASAFKRALEPPSPNVDFYA
ncbi:NAD(+) synthase [Eggerthellaceae bacterium 3-80]|nr:NAD(+) synthase [bacterium D16-34]